MDITIIDFLLVCTLMGLGIGLDVAIATFAMGSRLNEKSTATAWISGVTLTHTIFPMCGYLLSYFSVKSIPFLMPYLGVVAFALIAHFIYQSLRDHDEDSSALKAVNLSVIIAVSWDALWSGPAKSAQVLHWSELYVWLSFFVVGFVVMACALLSLYLFNLVKNAIVEQPAERWYFLGLWLQHSVIGYFGLLALSRYTLQINVNEVTLFVSAMILVAIAMMLSFSYRLRLQNQE